jgi:primosomal replication protein N
VPDNIFENNTVHLLGKIVKAPKFNHELYGESFHSFELEVQRLSKCFDNIPVLVSDRLVDIELLGVGKIIQVKGQFRSYNSADNSFRKLMLMAFAREIEITELTEIEEPSSSFNEIFLNGFICKKPMYRKTPFGREICDLLLAVNRQYYKSDYIPCICWGRNAKYAELLSQGNNIKIWGRVQSRVYQKKHENGEITEHRAYEVSVSKLELIPESKAESDSKVEEKARE